MPTAPDYLNLPAPEPGKVVEIMPGLRWARMPLPFPPRHVNVWLLRDGEGWLAIDAGARTDDAATLWESVFAAGLDGLPITRVLVTHFHPDHIGFAGWLCERWGAPLLMTRSEYLFARFLRLDDDEGVVAQQVAFARRAGCEPAQLQYLTARGALYGRAVLPLPRSYRRIAAGDRLSIDGRDWSVMTGGGHAPEMACLYDAERGVLISADQILPRISPYVGVGAVEPEADPLADFLSSNARFRSVPPETLVLPSHGEPFTGLHQRIDALDAHHAERLATLEAGCATPRTAFEASRILFPRATDDRQMGFALGETLAHLHRLIATGRLLREDAAVPLYRKA
jgi:glyoxylase-like metal-dependent hydrolase (beta-lactamase superfamily II)